VIWGTGAYKVFLTLHLLSVIIGFGPWFLNGLIPARAMSAEPAEGKALSRANLQVSTVSQFAIYGVVVFGAATLGSAHKHTIDFGDAFVWVSIILWVAIVGILHGLILPAQRALAEGSGDRATLTQRQSLGAALLNLLVVVAVVLMVWEPGGHLPY
jgi:hypothetical protein